MIDPNTMTLNALRDWLAERKGWRTDKNTPGVQWWHHRDKPSTTFHPIPATLDAAAAAMPKRIGIGGFVVGQFSVSKCFADEIGGGYTDGFHAQIRIGDTIYEAYGDTEILARFRLAALCILAEESHNERT